MQFVIILMNHFQYEIPFEFHLIHLQQKFELNNVNKFNKTFKIYITKIPNLQLSYGPYNL